MGRVHGVVEEDVLALMGAKLALSGLDMDDASRLGLSALTAAESTALGFWRVPAIHFRYLGLDGVTPLRDGVGHPDFCRARYLREPPTGADGSKPAKYLQPSGTHPHAYLPRNVPVVGGWAAVAENVDEHITITEGELKAAKACKEGFPTVGLGGVNSFRSLKRGQLLVPELAAIEWPRRVVDIVFDDDVVRNPNVQRALMELADELAGRGAVPRVVLLPSVYDDGDAKTGLDDFLVHAGRDRYARLVERSADHLTLVQPLWGMNARWAWVHSVGAVVNLRTGAILEPGKLSNYVTAQHPERVLKAGHVSYRLVNASSAWLSWPLRRELQGVCYEPALAPRQVVALPRGHEHGPGEGYNVWPGWGCEPKEGDVTLFLRLLDHMFLGAEPWLKDYLIKWLAYPLQHPGAKLTTSFVIFSLVQGTGKSMVGYIMGLIYGQNFDEIGESDFASSFNTWMARKQFILGDDVSGSDKKADRERLKKLITQKSIRVNEKFAPIYNIRDTVNYMWTTNQSDALLLEDHDRRFVIHEIVVSHLAEEFYTKVLAWMESGDCGPAVFHYLLNVDLTGFNPGGRAPATKAKGSMTRQGLTEIELMVRNFTDDPGRATLNYPMLQERDLFTSEELKLLIGGEDNPRVTMTGISRALKKAGFGMVHEEGNVKTPDGRQARYFAVRNPERWLTAPHAELVEHLCPGQTKRERHVKPSKFVRK